MKARLEKSKLQHQLSNPSMMPVLINNGKIQKKKIFFLKIFFFLVFKPTFNHTKSGPDHVRMYNDRHSPLSFYPIMEQSLVDDARTAYEYGLSSTPPTVTNDFSFVDQRVPIQQQTRQTHSWFGTPNQQNLFLNRTFSMPPPPPPQQQQQQQQQQPNLFTNNDSQRMMEEQQQMAAAMLMHQQQQQQNWARQQQQQMFPMQQQPPPQQFEQVK